MTKLCNLFYTDDEKRNSDLYIDELKHDFSIRYIRVVESVKWYLDQIVADGPGIIVQDVMLPHPDDPNGAFDVSAGIRLMRELQDDVVKLNIGVILFSNRVRKDLEKAAMDNQFSSTHFVVHNKYEVGFDKLANIARELYFRLNPR